VDVGDSPKISAQSEIAYVRDGRSGWPPLDSSEKPKQLIVRGQNQIGEWSPDGTHLVFVSTRGDHSFIGIFDAAAKSVNFIAPTVDTDSDPVWSVDGKRIAFVRRPPSRATRPQVTSSSLTSRIRGRFGLRTCQQEIPMRSGIAAHHPMVPTPSWPRTLEAA